MAKNHFIELGEDAKLNFISEQDRNSLGFNCWDPEEYEKHGWKRRWGDAAVTSEYFEVLVKKEEDGGVTFRILCPTFLRRPLDIYCPHGGDASY